MQFATAGLISSMILPAPRLLKQKKLIPCQLFKRVREAQFFPPQEAETRQQGPLKRPQSQATIPDFTPHACPFPSTFPRHHPPFGAPPAVSPAGGRAIRQAHPETYLGTRQSVHSGDRYRDHHRAHGDRAALRSASLFEANHLHRGHAWPCQRRKGGLGDLRIHAGRDGIPRSAPSLRFESPRGIPPGSPSLWHTNRTTPSWKFVMPTPPPHRQNPPPNCSRSLRLRSWRLCFAARWRWACPGRRSPSVIGGLLTSRWPFQKPEK